MNKALQNYECEGQLSIFDFLKKPKAEPSLCAGDWVEEHGPRIKFDDIRENHYYIADYSTESHKWYKLVYVKWIEDDSIGYVDSEKGVKGKWTWGNNHSALTRKEHIDADRDTNPLAKMSDTNGWWYEVQKPISVDIRCNGSEEPKKQETTDDYIQENPSCFYVFGHYLDREDGWHKVPDELPTFTEWTTIDVVIFGKKTGTAWMEHGKWEAKDWTFRSVDQRRTSEDTEILAWKVSD